MARRKPARSQKPKPAGPKSKPKDVSDAELSDEAVANSEAPESVVPAEKYGPDAREAEEKPAPKTRPRRGRTARRPTGQKDGSDETIEALKKRREEARRAEAGSDVPDPEPEIPSHPVRTTRNTRARRSSPENKTDASSPTKAKERPSTPEQVADSSPKSSQRRGRPRRIPSSAVKAQSTPMVGASMLVLQNFQRRSRQPSVLRMVASKQALGSVDADEDISTFDLGDDSILMNSSPMVGKKQAGLEVLVPGTPAGATPLVLTQVSGAGEVIMSTQEQEAEENKRQDKPADGEEKDDADDTFLADPDFIQDPSDLIEAPEEPPQKAAENRTVFPSSPPLLAQGKGVKAQETSHLPGLDDDSDDAPLSDVPSLSESGELTPITATDSVDIMAPPQSSSDFSDSEATPEPPKATRPSKPQKATQRTKKPLMTADLRSLLPQLKTRRTNNRESDEDEDEPESRPNRKKRKVSGESQKDGRGMKNTYARRSLGGRSHPISREQDENRPRVPDSDETVTMDKEVQREMSVAAKKFAEIDSWSMEFESVSQSTADE